MSKTISLHPSLLKKVIQAPEIALEDIDLVYANENQLSITREKKDNEFIYLRRGKPIKTPKDLTRIQKLVIPPAWRDVKIADYKNLHLQAIGRDLKKRKQYRYHPLWIKVRNQTKFYKMIHFGKALPKLRAKVDSDLDQSQWTKSKVLALVIRLMEETHIRIGNEEYAKKNKTYGLSTMRTRHLKTFKDKIKFEFTGKKGKKHSVTLRNKRLIRLVNQCEEIPGWELFQYFDDNKDKHSIDSQAINNYLHDIAGEYYTAKDFRTWAGSVLFFESLLNLGIPKSEKDKAKNVIKAYDSVAKHLGNTRAVCKKYYVHPFIAASYEDDSIASYFKQVEQQEHQEYLTATEQTLIQILNDYTPTIVVDKL
ncbi:DNA topoisomerase IB [Aquimarina brevivitae]|uniref:DNA topoisomerase n=1 Tax=Aquimarina brevivitae TaxID=323412 RepID=A0A4Q7PHI9_9FLAO|nr:DNA topoisomerase IB [Aquimarina brevivitae]RZT00044.1 DNA topoisomerase-1 [Aquimarina brevivitae]